MRSRERRSGRYVDCRWSPRDARRLYERTLKTAEIIRVRHSPLQRTFTWVWRTCFVRQGKPSRPRDTAVAKNSGEAASLPENRYRWFVTMSRLMVAGGDPLALEMLDQAEALPSWLLPLRCS